MLKLLLDASIIIISLMPAYAFGRASPSEQETTFMAVIGEANKHRERYDAIVEYTPKLARDSEVTEPAKLAAAWLECKRSMAAHRSYGHAQQSDAFFVAYPDGQFAASKERASIAIALAARNRESNASLEPELYKCLNQIFSVKVAPFP